MPLLQSARPRPELLPFVRAYAQRDVGLADPVLVESVPAQLEQVLNLELGALPGVRHRKCNLTSRTWIGGAQTSFAGHMQLSRGVQSFAVFFQPAGWSQLFDVPMYEITNRVYDAESVLGACMRTLWHQLREESAFDGRVAIVEQFLLPRAARALAPGRITSAATYLFNKHGAVSVSTLSRRDFLGVRQFERLFRREAGASPKAFARVARFQAALDAKLSSPHRTWLDIAHRCGYYDQMHMVHDFENLGHNTPTRLLADMGDVRPHALTSATV